MLTEQNAKDAWLRHIFIIQAVALALGAYLIATTVLISRDGIMFIEFAKDLSQNAVGAMLNNYQHPGYPLLIYVTNKIFSAANFDPFWSWIYSAQTAALLCRMGALGVLYFVGRKFVGQRFSFWAVLILALMPPSTELGSDALSDWPNLFVLAAGFLILIKACQTNQPLLFCAAGLLAGIGYLIRPESFQLVIYAGLWLLVSFFRSKLKRQRLLVIAAAILLIIGFAIPAAPYMKLKGAVFPKKSLDFSQGTPISVPAAYEAGIAPKNIAGAIWMLCTRICELLVYFFAIFLPIGIWRRFKDEQTEFLEKFLISCVLAINAAVLIWLYCRHGYLSRRHALWLVAITIFYVPVGIQAVSSWIGMVFYKNKSPEYALITAPRIWFFILIICGLAIAAPKLLRPLGSDKSGYREVAAWLEANTAADDVIIVPDSRISFYAKRKGLNNLSPQSNAKYIVKIVSDNSVLGDKIGGELFAIDKEKSKKSKLTVYKLNM